MARISLDPPLTPTYRLTRWYSRRTYDAVLDPGAAMAHNPRVLRSYLRFEQSVARWHRLDGTLAAIAELAGGGADRLSWCLDFGYWESTRRGVDPASSGTSRDGGTATSTPTLERAVLEYAEAMSADPVAVTDEMVDAAAARPRRRRRSSS